MIDVFRKLNDLWFLSEPLLFAVLCTHKLVENNKMTIPLRTGKMKIEYNSQILKKHHFEEITEFFKIEIIRILLKHPYQRMPYKANREALAISSIVTISENYDSFLNLPKAKDFNITAKNSFEEYYKIFELLFQQTNSNKTDDEDSDDSCKADRQLPSKGNKKNTGDSGTENQQDSSEGNKNNAGNSSTADKQHSSEEDKTNKGDSGIIDKQNYSEEEEDKTNKGNSGTEDKQSNSNEDKKNIEDSVEEYKQLSALWEEDNLSETTINNLIQQAKETDSWGSLPGNVVDLIEASTIVKLNYRKILNSFRASLLSSERELTRMRPSRRYGFQYMGRKSEFTTKLLVAVDVSGSVTCNDLQNFFSVVNRFFKYGIPQVDIIQFDTEIKGEITSLKKAKKTVKIEGCGGTNFQCVFDYLCKNPIYDGLIIFTDGYAEVPNLKADVNTKILWVLDNEENYNEHEKWMMKLPKSRAIWIE